MAQKDLIPYGSEKDTRSKEEVKAAQRKGGINSGKTRRKQKALKDIATLMGRTIAPETILKDLEKQGIIGPDELVTYDEAVMLAQYAKAAKGNTQAAIYLRDTSGQKPSDRVEINDITKETSKLDELLKQRKEINESE